MLNLAVLHLPTRLHHLKPAQVAQALVGKLDRRLDRILNAARGRARQFNDLVDMLGHHTPPLLFKITGRADGIACEAFYSSTRQCDTTIKSIGAAAEGLRLHPWRRCAGAAARSCGARCR